MEREETGRLRSDVVGIVGAATLGIVMLSPAMTIYGSFGPSFVAAGRAAPLAFVLGLLATLPTAVSYALLSRDYPDSGSAASWIGRAAPAWLGCWAGWIVFLYYFNNFIIQPVTLGVFLNDLLKSFGASPGFPVYAFGAFVCCAAPAFLAYRGIAVSTEGALGFLLFESAVVVALCLTVFFALPHDAAHFTAEGFHVSSSPAGLHGLWSAMVFSMLAYCGFDVVSTLSEETHMPRRLIPQATLLSLTVFAVIIIAGIWCLSFAMEPQRLRAAAEAGGMPISEIARGFWGRWAALVPMTAISAALGIAIATSVGASRVLFSMGRAGLASPAFARLHERYRVPWNAMHVIFAVGLLAALVSGAALGAYQSYVWWGTTSTFFAMLTYLMVNAASLLLFKDRLLRSPGDFVLHGLIPALGLAADGYILIRSFFLELWAQGWGMSRGVILFDLACAAAALYAATRSKEKGPAPQAAQAPLY